MNQHTGSEEPPPRQAAQIEQAKHEWEMTIDALPQLICLVNLQGRILRANATVEAWKLGEVTKVKRSTVHALFHPVCGATACPLAAFFEQALVGVAHGEMATWETDDPYLARAVRVEVRPIVVPRRQAGPRQPSCAAVIVYDLTRRKQLEAALRTSEAHYRHLVDDGLGLICSHDLNGVLLSVNPAASRCLGYQPNEGIGQSLREFLAPAVRPLFQAYLERIRQQGRDSGCMYVVTKTGEERVWLYDNVLCEDTGRPPYVLGHAQDVTSLIVAQRQLRESEERFRNLVEGSIQGILVHRHFQPLFVNQVCAAMFGYDTTADILNLPSLLPLIAPHERARLEQYNALRLEGGEAPAHYECQSLRQDGTMIWTEVRVKAVLWDGQPASQCTFYDITERKHTAAQLAQTYAQIEQYNAHLLSIVQQLRTGVAVLDAAGQVVFLNTTCQNMLGTRATQGLGQPWHEVLPFDPPPAAALARLTALPIQEPFQFTACLVGQSNRRYWVEVDVQVDPRDAQRTLLFVYDRSEVYDLRRLLDGQSRFHNLVGKSDPMLRVYKLIGAVAETDTTVLIEGETGTGKELVARAIHAASRRSRKPFIAVNCGGLSEAMLSSQLFGHKRGAFTGAIADHRGLCEAAEGGTLFLDEVGDMPWSIQTHLLRMIQEREVTRLGESTPRKIDVRILVATQHDLAAAVANSTFRADLLFRIRVARLHLPPLRQRREDIPLLVSAFLSESCATMGKSVTEVSEAAMHCLLTYAWPGNVRELRSAIDYAVLCCPGAVIQPADLPPEVTTPPGQSRVVTVLPSGLLQDEHDDQTRLLAALKQAHGNRRHAARLLGISKSTFYRRLSKLGLSPTA